jgi:hypothetical protein
MTDHDDRTVDQAVEAALRRIPVPDHTPDFWQRLDARLSPATGAGVDVRVDPHRRNGHHAAFVQAPPSDTSTLPGLDGGGSRAGEVAWSPPDEPTATGLRRLGAAPPLPADTGGLGRRRGRRRSGRWRLAAATAAAVAVAAAAVVLVLAPDPDGGQVETRPSGPRHGPSTTSTTDPTGPTTSATAETTTMPAVSDVPPGSEDAVLGFLDALGRGDLAGAASHLGLASEAYISTAARSVEDFLLSAEEGYGAWADAEGRMTSTVVLGPGDVVVVVSGTLQLEGTVEERTQAFPVRYAQSAGAWLVEPWALDPEGGQLLLRTPDPTGGGQSPVSDGVDEVVDEVVATTPRDGTAWLAVDDQPPRATTVGTEREATWSLDEPLPPGRHTLTIAFVADMTFVATSASYVVAS